MATVIPTATNDVTDVTDQLERFDKLFAYAGEMLNTHGDLRGRSIRLLHQAEEDRWVQIDGTRQAPFPLPAIAMMRTLLALTPVALRSQALPDGRRVEVKVYQVDRHVLTQTRVISADLADITLLQFQCVPYHPDRVRGASDYRSFLRLAIEEVLATTSQKIAETSRHATSQSEAA